jgi:ribosomal protein L4
MIRWLLAGKMRNRRYVLRKGPLIIYANNNGIAKAFRNLPGVEVASVDSLNLLQVEHTVMGCHASLQSGAIVFVRADPPVQAGRETMPV